MILLHHDEDYIIMSTKKLFCNFWSFILFLRILQVLLFYEKFTGIYENAIDGFYSSRRNCCRRRTARLAEAGSRRWLSMGRAPKRSSHDGEHHGVVIGSRGSPERHRRQEQCNEGGGDSLVGLHGWHS